MPLIYGGAKLPIERGGRTGPFYKEEHRNIPGGYYLFRSWYRQPRPYRKRLPYIMVFKAYDSFSEYPYAVSGLGACPQSVQLDCQNQALRKFSDALGEKSQILVTLAERQKTFDMMTKRLTQLTRFIRSLRSGNFKRAFRELPNTIPRNYPTGRLRRGSRSFADNFLELHFGWVPLVKDIGNALDVFTRPPPLNSIRGTARIDTEFLNYRTRDTKFTGETTVRCKIVADVRITSPNLYLANQLGLINPISVVWERIPFSFVVDWFVNVSQVIGSLSEYCGLSLLNPSTTLLSRTDTFYSYGTVSPFFYSGHTIEMVRREGVPTPTLRLKPFKGFSVTRGVTAISLLLQQLRK